MPFIKSILFLLILASNIFLPIVNFPGLLALHGSGIDWPSIDFDTTAAHAVPLTSTPPVTEELEDAKVYVSVKQTKKLVLLVIKNHTDESIFGVKITLSIGQIAFVKARGWDRDMVDQNTVLLRANDKPLLTGHSLMVIMSADSAIASFEWSVFNRDNHKLSGGIKMVGSADATASKIFPVVHKGNDVLKFSVLTYRTDSDMINVLRKYYREHDYVLVGKPEFNENFPDHRKIIFGASIDRISKVVKYAKELADNLNIVAYNPEHWDRTPSWEQENLPKAVSEAADIVHSAGYRFGVAPDGIFMSEYYKSINWKEVDFVDIQFQRYATDVGEFSSLVKEVSAYIRSINPNTEIFVQVSFRHVDAGQMISAVESVKDPVDGVIVAYMRNCQYCSLDNLVKVLMKLA